MPDPLGYADVIKRPDLVNAVLRGRDGDHPDVRDARAFGYPKPSDGRRTMVRVDPYTDIVYRDRVGRAVRQIESRLSPGVRHTRCEDSGTSWAAQDHREAGDRLRADQKQDRAAWPAPELSVDVSSHFPTVTTSNLRNCLSDAGVPDASSDHIAETIDNIDRLASVSGLPIGPEGSAPLGTIALVSIDELIQSLGYRMYRWMDDITICGVAAEDKDSVIAELQAGLANLGQALNSEKTTYDLIDELVDRERSTDEGTRGPAAIFDGDPIAWLRDAAEEGAKTDMKFVLGGLRLRGDPDALEVLRDHRWIMERFPKQAGSYIRAVLDGRPARVEWVQDYLTEPVTDDTAPAQMHLVRSLPSTLISASLGRLLFDLGAALTATRYSCLADHMLAAGSRSGEKLGTRRSRALEFAREQGPLDGRRAALTAFQRGGIPPVGRNGLEALARSEPDLIPTIEFVKES
jgi:hypothetical protein